MCWVVNSCRFSIFDFHIILYRYDTGTIIRYGTTLNSILYSVSIHIYLSPYGTYIPKYCIRDKEWNIPYVRT